MAHRSQPRRMRYTKTALLLFGFGMLLGLAVVAADLAGFERVASGVMALGLVLLPIGLIADARGSDTFARVASRLQRGRKPRSRRAPVRRPRQRARRPFRR